MSSLGRYSGLEAEAQRERERESTSGQEKKKKKMKTKKTISENELILPGGLFLIGSQDLSLHPSPLLHALHSPYGARGIRDTGYGGKDDGWYAALPEPGHARHTKHRER